MPDMPSVAQTYIVSNLQERLHNAKHDLPSPPIEQKHTGKGTVKEVTIYTTQTCPWCRRTKDYLSQKGISYIEYDIAADRAKTREKI